MNEFEELALKVASQSPCEKRKVGAVLVHNNEVINQTYNYIPADVNGKFDTCCENLDGTTKDTVQHAEVALFELLTSNQRDNMVAGEQYDVYVTHTPCKGCESYMDSFARRYGIRITVSLVEQFMKFDSGKLAFDLIPPLWERGLAEVLTKGAQKYKPNNWKEIKPEEMLRYYAAARRHMLAWLEYMEGKEGSSLFDDGDMGIGTHHLMNAMTNLGFLLTLTETEEIKNGSK